MTHRRIPRIGLVVLALALGLAGPAGAATAAKGKPGHHMKHEKAMHHMKSKKK